MITTNLRKKLIKHYNDLITKIIINDSNEILEYELLIEETVLIVQFVVPEEVSEIRRIRIWCEEDLLSDSTLYVPINGDTVFKYKAEVMEFGN